MDNEPARSIPPDVLAWTAEQGAQRPKRKLWIWITLGAGAFLAVGLVMLGLLATLVVPNVLSKFAFATREKAKVDIVAIESAIKEYSIHNGGMYPDRLEDLVTPDVNGRMYLDQQHVPKDPWGHEYIYEPPGPGQPHPIVRSYGKDGQPGGEGDDADIDNLSIREEGRSPRHDRPIR
jgi:general secretion pathway protein G